MAKFSIIIPMYKVEEYIDRCILSLLTQTFSDFEAIFIDDCGGDKTLSIVEDYAQIDERFRIIRHESNLGTGISRNHGLEASVGKYVCFLDPDDWVNDNYLEEINRAFELNPEINWVLFKYKEEFDKNLSGPRFSAPPRYFSHSQGVETITPFTIFQYTIFCWAKAYRRSWLTGSNIWYPKETYEETPFYIKCVLESPQIYFLNQTLIHYTIRPNSWTTNEDINEVRKNLKSLDSIRVQISELFESEKYDQSFLEPCSNMLERFYESQVQKENRILKRGFSAYDHNV